MSARIVRRSFASPFVVTLAAALPAAACYVQPAPTRPANTTSTTGTASEHGTAGTDEPGHTNPPRPQQPPMTNMPNTTNAGVEQAANPNTTVISNPPRPAPAPKVDLRWAVTRAAGTCTAHAKVTCPTAPAGQPAPMCNPPPPTAYTCGSTMTADGTTNIVQFAGQTECQIEHPPMKCPAGAICNPPPPQKVACPQ